MDSVAQDTVICESCRQVAPLGDVIRKGLNKEGQQRYRHAKGKGCAAQQEYQAEPPPDQSLALVSANVHLLIDIETQQGNLTNMHRAAGYPENKEPAKWQENPSAKEFIGALAESLNIGKSDILQADRGRSGGTWAHWQICVEYARYLSPAFAIRWNEYARLYLEGRAQQPTPQPVALLPSGIENARSTAMQVQHAANAFLQALDMAGRRGVEFGDAMQQASPQVARIVQAMPELTHPRKAGFVYLTREPNDRHNHYKIGKSIDAEKREGQIPGQMPTIVRHVKVIKTDDCAQLESELKAYFKGQRYGKEWYRLSDQQVSAFCDLPDYFPSTRFRELSALLATEQIVQAALL